MTFDTLWFRSISVPCTLMYAYVGIQAVVFIQTFQKYAAVSFERLAD